MSRDMAHRITQQQLESYLWGAATLLRGTIDAGDYKQFIFPLLFYKRVAYLSPADNVSRPLPYCLHRLNQPVMSPPSWFFIPRSTLLSSI